MKKDAVWAVTIATVLMLLYIWFRLWDIRFAASATRLLVHDVLLLPFYPWRSGSVGSTFIACMLTIVGYSINATIVIFDRIRENLAPEEGRQQADTGRDRKLKYHPDLYQKHQYFPDYLHHGIRSVPSGRILHP